MCVYGMSFPNEMFGWLVGLCSARLLQATFWDMSKGDGFGLSIPKSGKSSIEPAAACRYQQQVVDRFWGLHSSCGKQWKSGCFGSGHARLVDGGFRQCELGQA